MHRQKGITLIELMMALAIVGILASIAYPSYQQHLVKSRRADAQAALLELAGFLERSYTVNGCYNDKGGDGICGTSDDTLPDLPFVSLQISGARREDRTVANMSYEFILEVGQDGGTYTLTAIPGVDSSQANDGVMTLDQAGRKRWDKNNNGDLTEDGETAW